MLLKGFIYLFILILNCCGYPLKEYYKTIERLGFIPYTNPIAYSSTGTLIAGRPSRLSFIAPPYSCFPTNKDQKKNPLRFIDRTDLPNQYKELRINVKSHLKYLEALKDGAPSINFKLKNKKIKNIKIIFGEAFIEYMDTVRLIDFIKNEISTDCYNYLFEVGFIIQALKGVTDAITNNTPATNTAPSASAGE